ncbi:hypothetical protein Vafri_8532 [Volvox africanus]|nr:hypothetical protein Vafri_8532 [Volvox africanus]
MDCCRTVAVLAPAAAVILDNLKERRTPSEPLGGYTLDGCAGKSSEMSAARHTFPRTVPMAGVGGSAEAGNTLLAQRIFRRTAPAAAADAGPLEGDSPHPGRHLSHRRREVRTARAPAARRTPRHAAAAAHSPRTAMNALLRIVVEDGPRCSRAQVAL